MHGLVMVVGVEVFIITITSKFYCFTKKRMNCIIKADDRAGGGGRGRGRGVGISVHKGEATIETNLERHT